MWRVVRKISVGLIVLLLFTSVHSALSAETSNADVEDLMVHLSLEQKVGQVMFVFFRGSVPSETMLKRMETIHPGGVILYSVSGNIEEVNQICDLVEELQVEARSSGDLPLFVGIDQEGGLVTRITDGVTVFPGNMALGAADDIDLGRTQAAIMAEELRTLGINFNFAPVVDVNSNPRNPVIGIRSFGSSPERVADFGRAMIAAYAGEGVLCSAKHFPGHGDTDVDSHLGLPRVRHDRKRLNEVELLPFREVIREGVPAVMTAHVVVPALKDAKSLPATLSPAVLGFLRDEMDFKGIILTDSMGMGAISENWGMAEASIRALHAGADMLLFGADLGHEPERQIDIHRAIVSAVRSGRISRTRLDEAVRRVLSAKVRYGLIDDFLPRRNRLEELASAENRAIAERIAEASVTVIRGGGLLPLSGEAVPLIWPKKYSAALDILVGKCPFLRPYLLPMKPSAKEIATLAASLESAPTVLIGGYDLYRHVEWRNVVSSMGGKEVMLLSMRSPYDLLEVPEVAGCVATYGDRPPSMRVLARLLRGEIRPSGHLPVELPGLYPRGWGETRLGDGERSQLVGY